jgi:membrane protease YdiL (CAAX protease family)
MTVVWIGHATYHLGLFRLATDQTNAPQLLPNSLGIATSALIALLEELLFRGWLQNELYRVDHALNADVYSIFAINLLFGLMHYNRGFMFALSAGFVGMIFSIATLASGSLLPAIVMHVGWNVLTGLARLRPHEVVESEG